VEELFLFYAMQVTDNVKIREHIYTLITKVGAFSYVLLTGFHPPQYFSYVRHWFLEFLIG
jgi:hypothetical protein